MPKVGGRTIVGVAPRRPGAGAQAGRRWGRAVGLALLGTALAAGPAAAQDDESGGRLAARLTVRPREMTLATRTEKAGVFPMPGGGNVYVPLQCVGTQRCPLLVNNFPDASPDSVLRYYLRPGADEFGIILLVVASDDPNQLDTVLTQVLTQFAIDPDKIAGSEMLAFANPEVFNRAFVFAGTPGVVGQQASSRGMEVYEDAGVTDNYNFALTTLAEMATLRTQGYRTKQWLGLRSHGFNTFHGYGAQATFHFLARWLRESWDHPDPAARSAPTVIDPLPRLTPQALAQMIAFWENFRHEPDSVLTTVRHQHLRELLVPVGPKEGWPSTGMVDMAALAAAVPSVAAKLKAAGLTAQQHDAYRMALLSAIFLAVAQNPAIPTGRRLPLPVDPTSVLGQNVAFVLAHPDEVLVLEQTGIWMIP